jgi:hypothetical protein
MRDRSSLAVCSEHEWCRKSFVGADLIVLDRWVLGLGICQRSLVEVVDTVPLDPTAIVLDDRAWDSAVAPIVEFSQDL